MRKYFLITAFVLANAVFCLASQINQKIYLNRGVFTTVNSTSFSAFGFNSTTIFSNTPALISVTTIDTLQLKIINNDSIQHGFDIKNYNGVNSIILPGDSVIISFHANQRGTFIYFDPTNTLNFTFTGASGMIAVKDINDQSFYWTIKDFQSEFNDSIALGLSVNWQNYYPDYFTINGNSNPDINSDNLARVTGNVNDTIYIHVANTGKAKHALHFHGYHLEIIYSSYSTNDVNRHKDTFPFYTMESMTLMLVPDKPGEYPVHDHNLVAVTGGNIYPNGMFTSLLINP